MLSARLRRGRPATRSYKAFYEQFWWETFELKKHIEKIMNDLPGLSEDRKTEILKADDVEHWSKAPDVAQALRDYLVSRDDYLNHVKMRQALEKLQTDRLAGSTQSSFLERFKFWKKEKHRPTCLKNLETWNRRVAIVVEAACKATEGSKAVSTQSNGPSSRLRTLSRRLFAALSKCWPCDCESRHEARFCLANCIHSNKDSGQGGIHFDFLIAHPQCQTKWKWRECTVMIKAPSPIDSQNRAILGKICDVGPNVQRANYCLQLLIEDLELSQRVWRLNWQQAQLAHLESKPAITFQMMLQSCSIPSLMELRRLALIFAHSLVQLHESPWLSQHWTKDRTYFFYNSTGILDLHRPYLSTSFDDFPLSGEPTDLNRFHRNLGILRLGILLIDVHNWKPLESFRMKDDLYNGAPTPNTNMEVAWRVQGTLHDCFPTYRDAIQSCLKVPWVNGGLRVTLEDPETWNRVYSNIIQPLEREVALGAVVL
ncbi:hypothetical protein EDB81DRAFT_899415 [Dactylonectria macrodidyma]|uniref:DUF7580 domain-containing protein n=1 Tax=Dactylonectria macrodidyma TaxID=307937 RepID=A0A9P9ERS6_9HYPO|nr:hypothetical protein EDB81DRAFT_899415 [Dactylonectria macrodidyma]